MKDIGIYAIGNLGSKMITFFMVPLYTYYIPDTSEFGYYDMCLTVILFLIPLVTLQLRDGAFRYLLDADSDERRSLVISFVYKSLAFMVAAAILVVSVVTLFADVKYIWYSLALLCAMSLYEVVAQVARGLGDTKTFITSGILASFGVGVFSILFVVMLGWGVVGVFVANILARVVALLYIECKDDIISLYFLRNRANKEEMKVVRKEVLKYSLPLLFSAIFWWLIKCSDRFFIIGYMGLESNGIYAVATRFTSILQTLGIIFYQAWQDMAIRQYNSNDREAFFSKMFNMYIFALVVILLLYTFGLKLNYSWLVEDSYSSSMKLLYLLGMSAVLSAIASFVELVYQCACDTVRIMPQMLSAAAINILLNFLLIKPLGMYSVIFASNLTYLFLLVYRWYDTRRYLRFKLSPFTFVPIAVSLLGIWPFYCTTAMWQDVVFVMVALAVTVYATPKQYRSMVVSLFHRRKSSGE